MPTSNESDITVERELCAICGGDELEVTIELPNLPLTGIFCREAVKEPARGIDQQLLICPACGHGQLAREVSPGIIYGDSYSFRSADSATGRQGTSLFLTILNEITGQKKFDCILDIGCNDLYLLKQLEGRSKVRVGIDPIWASIEEQRGDKSITVSGTTIEDADLETILETPPDLIVCRHVLEHIHEPRAVLQKLLDVAAEDALFLFEVPSLEALVQRLRFDQIFHQHLQYFTLVSFQRLLAEIGAVSSGYRENYQNWPAWVVAFRKRTRGQRRLGGNDLPVFQVPTICERYALFRQQMSTTNEVLNSFAGTTVYGYGAAQMLPILAYHLNNNLAMLRAVLDDDPAKDGLHYGNLPLEIRYAGSVTGLEEAAVFITAVDNVKPILSKLLGHHPRHIIYPFNII
ncbi:MAG: methyltransferase domain-containing protein [Chloroflexi bacterium]|nr:methyltransferase domain-containing protein [Chloroflexota bacterium]